MLRKVFLPLLIVFITFPAGAQDKVYNLSGSWVPQNLIRHGLRIDFDIRLKLSHWLVIAPQVYLDHRYAGPYGGGSTWDRDEDYYYEEMYGYGLELHHRIYLKNNNYPTGLYFSYGFNYVHFNITSLQLFQRYTNSFLHCLSGGTFVHFFYIEYSI